MIKDNFCKLCSSKKEEIVFQNNNLTVVSCLNCGLVKLNPHLSKEEYHKYYEKDYDQTIRPKLIDNSFKNPDSITEMLMLFKKAGVNMTPKNVLDIGAGDGEVIKQLRKNL